MLRRLRNRIQQLRGLLDRWNTLFKGEGLTSRAGVYKRLSRFGFHLVLAILVTLIIRESPGSFKSNWVTGDVASEDIVSPVTATIRLNRGQLAREELIRRIPPVFDYDDEVITLWLARWEKAFKTIREEFYSRKVPSERGAKTGTAGKLMPSPQLVAERLYQLTGSRHSGREFAFLHRNRFSQAIERSFVRLGEHLSRRIISPSNIFPLYYNTGIYVRLTNQSSREVVVNDISRIWSLEQAQDFISQIARSAKALQIEGAPVLVDIMSPLIPVNLIFNQPATQKRFSEAISNARRTQVAFKKGQVIVKQGEQVTENLAEILTELEKRTRSSLPRTLVTALIMILTIVVTLRIELSSASLWNAGFKDSAFFALILLLQLGSCRLLQPLLEQLRGLSTFADPIYLFPVATGAIITHLMLGKEAAHLFSLLVAVCLGYRMDRSLMYGLFVLLTSWSAIHAIRSCRERNDLYKCGLWSACVGSLLSFGSIIGDYGFSADLTSTDLGLMIGYPILSGILSAALTSSLIPPLEALFGYTTSLKLMELANFNHPLLHALMLKSPGTYHHSVIVGSLAEIAADKVGANALLARVSAYYHDIGKMNKPLYFIENQSPNHNPHDSLVPSMSAKILFSHVKDGSRMAREYNLGDLITNIIEEHHGTTVVNYFFNKAKKSQNPTIELVEEGQFRYPGPKPQTKEAAIVMICDACEAATRSIIDPTAAKIQLMVHQIIEKRYLERQFDECDLFTSHLLIIEEAISRTLLSLYHHRIEYPGQQAALSMTSTSVTKPE